MSKFNFNSATIAWFISPLLILPQAQAQEVDFKWKFEAADKFSVVMQQQTQIVSQVDRRSRTSSNDMRIWIEWEVVDVGTNQLATIEQTITRITLETKTPNEGGEQVTKVDTNDAGKAQGLAAKLAKLIQPLIGGTVTIQMNDRGGIESVEIPEATMESLRQAPASLQLRQLFTEQGLREMFGQAAIEMPNEPVPPGKTWESSKTISSELGTFDQVQMFTYSPSEKEAGPKTITLKTELRETSPSESGARLETFKGSGDFVYDPAKGIFTESKIDSQMVTSKPYRNMVIKTNVNSVIQLTVERQ